MSMFDTLDVLKKYGYVDSDRYANTNEVFNWKYKDDYLEITASRSMTLYSRIFSGHYNKYVEGEKCIDISGIYKSKSSIINFHFDMPINFESERSCLVWYYVSLISALKKNWEEYRSYKELPIQITKFDLLELPWIIEEKNNIVKKLLDLKKKKDVLRVTLNKNELSRLRQYVNNTKNTDIRGEEVIVNFDGDFVTWKAKDYKYAGAATGMKWPNSIILTYNHEWRLPTRLSVRDYVLTFCKDGLYLNNVLYSDVKVIGNIVGKVDEFEPELLSWLMKLANMYPKYEPEVNSKLDEEDFREWMIHEVGPSFNPYMDILVAMVATCPFFGKYNESNMEAAIRFFKKYPKGTEPLKISEDWEKSALAKVFDIIMFNRAEAGWKVWRNNN